MGWPAGKPNPGAANITGQRFGRLVAVSATGIHHTRKWTCRCDCGRTTEVLLQNLRRGLIQSCGCLRREKVIARSTSHGNAPRSGTTRTYRAWRHMLERCTDPNDRNFHNYGGRGIRVCKRWLKFENFLADMGSCPPNLTLERKNNDGNYEPDNCKWATRTEQARNYRRVKLNEVAVCIMRHAARRGVARKKLAQTFGVTADTVGEVIRYKTWRWR